MSKPIIEEIIKKLKENGESTSWFEELYSQSGDDTDQIPWADLSGNDYLKEWIDKTPNANRKNQKVLVIGCGLGDDAEYLAEHFGKVHAFDISPSAIKWAKKRFPESNVNYFVDDLLDEEANFQKLAPYDFIFECYTIQAMPRELKKPGLEVIPNLLAKSGELLIVCDGRENDEDDSAIPHPLSPNELSLLSKQLKEVTFEELVGHYEREFSKKTFRVLYQKV